MTEATVRLKLPIRQVVALAMGVRPPSWIERQLQNLSASYPHSAKSAEQRQDVLLKAAGQLQLAAKSLATKWDQLRPELQQTVVELAHAIASKLVLDQVAAGEFPIDNLVREVVGRLNTDQAISVRLHPTDFELWQQHVLSDPTLPEQHPQLKVQADAAVGRGDCQATSGEITIVYELRRQIDELRQQLISTVSGHE